MILADKIIALRKKAGWSQEELAEQLGVTRQSVSKWEGAQSMPDMEKILGMSRLFGVSTDYLLKEELGEPEYAGTEESTEMRKVTMEEANAYLTLRHWAAPRLSIATALCILSPVLLILLGALGERKDFPITENGAAGLGMCALLLLVAGGVALFILCSARCREYEFLEKETFETAYGVSGMVRERKKAFSSKALRLNLTGTLLCILSALPLFCASVSGVDMDMVTGVCVMLVLVALGAGCFVYAGTVQNAMERLLQEGEYAPEERKVRRIKSRFSLIYWLSATAVYLIASFALPDGNPGRNGVIWAVAGVLYGAVMAVVELLSRRKNRA